MRLFLGARALQDREIALGLALVPAPVRHVGIMKACPEGVQEHNSNNDSEGDGGIIVVVVVDDNDRGGDCLPAKQSI